MKLKDLLLEAMRRDLYTQLNKKRLTTIGDTEIIMHMTKHMDDDRNDYGNVARGDIFLPKDLQSALRVGIKKLLNHYSMDELLNSNNPFEINARLKKKKIIYDKVLKKDKKVTLYAGIIVAFSKMQANSNKVKVTVITIYKPVPKRRLKSNTIEFQVEI